MTKTLTLVWYFYRPLSILGLIFSLIGISQIHANGSEFIPVAILIKIVGYAGYIFYKHHFANRTYLYFLNAGHSIKSMYAYSIAFDFLLFLAMVICVNLVK
ncbi:hypothetical protein [Mucilaginibacter antarcticus]|uniref:Uncharacterized protein n=1 Tax=Mucilaginibacter antarcticus TaxID=1855725 RepID=A0ABW5XUL4_9SPHI